MGLNASVSSAFRNYIRFSGRATRSEFWWFFFFANLASFIAFVFAGAMLTFTGDETSAVVMVPLILTLVLIPPLLAVTARRLHDKGLTAWILLLGFIPFGMLAILILCALPGDNGPNSHGPDPLKPKLEDGFYPSRIPVVKDDD